jgi:hypothetical protein
MRQTCIARQFVQYLNVFDELELNQSEAVLLVVHDCSMNELWVTWAHRDLCIDLSRSLTAHSLKGRTRLKNTASGFNFSFLYLCLPNFCFDTFSELPSIGSCQNFAKCDAPLSQLMIFIPNSRLSTHLSSK